MIPKPITYSLKEDEMDAIIEMANDIYKCPKRRRGRAAEVVFESCKAGKILEFALERQGAILNSKKFNLSDLDSYVWDVLWDKKKTEVKRKRFIESNGYDQKTKYYSWKNPNHVKTFLSNTREVEQLIVGDYACVGKNLYYVKWMLITNVDENFCNYIRKSVYNQGQMIYNHKYDPNCNYLM
jgi:hypothetical protein